MVNHYLFHLPRHFPGQARGISLDRGAGLSGRTGSYRGASCSGADARGAHAGGSAGFIAARRINNELRQDYRLSFGGQQDDNLGLDIAGAPPKTNHNPFRPVAFSAEWRTDTSLSLAKQMYESRNFSAMPILADALQDAGCDNEDILNHCRGPGPHVRACWAVDLVLGKE